jgi:hypothetical protein
MRACRPISATLLRRRRERALIAVCAVAAHPRRRLAARRASRCWPRGAGAGVADDPQRRVLGVGELAGLTVSSDSGRTVEFKTVGPYGWCAIRFTAPGASWSRRAGDDDARLLEFALVAPSIRRGDSARGRTLGRQRWLRALPGLVRWRLLPGCGVPGTRLHGRVKLGAAKAARRQIVLGHHDATLHRNRASRRTCVIRGSASRGPAAAGSTPTRPCGLGRTGPPAHGNRQGRDDPRGAVEVFKWEGGVLPGCDARMSPRVPTSSTSSSGGRARGRDLMVA